MRKTVRLFSAIGPSERLGQVIAGLPPAVQRTLADVAGRADLPLAAGSWRDDHGGCLVANAVACVDGRTSSEPASASAGDGDRTLDLRMLDAFPQMSSRDLNALIVAWDEAAAQAAVTDDAGLRALLTAGLVRAGVALSSDAPGHERAAAEPGSAAARDRVASSPKVAALS